MRTELITAFSNMEFTRRRASEGKEAGLPAEGEHDTSKAFPVKESCIGWGRLWPCPPSNIPFPSPSFLTLEALLVIWRTLQAAVSQAQPPLGREVASSHQSLSFLSTVNQGFLWKGCAV